MPSTQNKTDLEILKEKLSTAKSMAVVDYAGTSVNDQVDIRRNLRKVGAELYVTKNTLINLATDGKLKESLEGMNAVVISYNDEVGGLKELFDWHNKNEKLTIKLGMLGDAVLSAKDVEQLSKLPGKNELISMLISRLQGPAYGLVNVMKAGVRDLANVMRAIEKKQQEAV
ncbi:50S ribosomal protein L10 [Candidatus Woesebacteria bacterium]|nr:50S ribosomal protein L10 [Candidatus Woesebacteria bacterium]